jgi:hypothetical protein
VEATILMGAKSEGLAELAADLRKAAERAVPDAKKVVGKGCFEIKKAAQRTIRAASHRGYLPWYPYSLGYRVDARGTVVTGEIGSDPAKLQGGLGDLLERGSVNNAPIPHTTPALDAEEPVMVRYMEELGARLVEGHPGLDGPVTDPGG